MNKSFLISLVIASAALNMHAQTEVAPYVPGVTPEGITYYLPRTELHFIVTAKHNLPAGRFPPICGTLSALERRTARAVGNMENRRYKNVCRRSARHK